MPVFALTNAGVVFKASGIGEIFIHLSGTIELSLILGKVIGIFLFTWLSVKLGIGALPPTVKWIHILGLGFLGGMGFTMSLFISNLAFSGPLLLDPAKIGILTGSLIAGILGYIILSITLDKSSAMDK
jgi:NhaA family Na+:H+ antiporter